MIFLAVALLDVAVALDFKTCFEPNYYNLFKKSSISGFNSTCIDGVLFYPVCEKKILVIRPINCSCVVDHCNLELDLNNDGMYNNFEVLNLINEYKKFKLDKLRTVSAVNYWKEF